VLSVWVRARGTPILWHIHDYVRSRRLMSRLLRWHARRCAAAIANSQSVAADLREACPSLQRVETIYNAIDLRRFCPQGPAADLDALCGLPPAGPGTVRVGLVATLAHWKGHRTFFRAISLLPAATRIRGYVIGGPIYQTAGSQYSIHELRSEANRLGLTDRVGFSGFIDDTASAMRALDIVVHASTSPEPFGMVIVEGMACGKAVVASRAGGAAEIFEDGVDAVGHPPGDAEALAKQLGWVSSDLPVRIRLGTAGRKRAERLYRGDRLAAELVALYGTIFAGTEGFGGIDARPNLAGPSAA
jgi:glycosyltransferase involved in cell wall biosynthesis